MRGNWFRADLSLFFRLTKYDGVQRMLANFVLCTINPFKRFGFYEVLAHSMRYMNIAAQSQT